MHNFVIITTYPEKGSKNIGDQLITNSLKMAIKNIDPDAKFRVIWRADSWDNVKESVLAADHVFFALGMRPTMHKEVYPYLSQLIKSGVKFSVISSGTDLLVSENTDIYSGFSKHSIELLHDVNRCAEVFTTRGVLSQEFCFRNGLDRAFFSGDVAFYDESLDLSSFEKDLPVNKIVVSDPHRANSYLDSIGVLIKGLKDIFPLADIVVALHGVNGPIESFCADMGIRCLKIYEDKEAGLKVYDDADLHVGYRVHGHVSALKRRKYSYLLEQDGRGSDYAATINRKISIPNYEIKIRPILSIKNIFRFFVGRAIVYKKQASVSPVYQILAMVRSDAREGFAKFLRLEDQIISFSNMIEQAIRKTMRKSSEREVE